jgi:hypothetical protein
MKLIDRIVLNRTVQIILNFILAILKMFNKPNSVETPKLKKRPIKDLLDKTLPWRKR